MNFYHRFGAAPVTNDYQYLLNQPSNIPPKIPSWFRRPAKVMKHVSRESSPRSLVRRRTTASVRAPSRHNSITDGRHHQKHHSTPNGIMSFEARGRPMSWHSTGLEQAAPQFVQSGSQFPSNVPSSYFVGPAFTTCEVNGAITPVTNPFGGEPFEQDAFTPLDEMSSRDVDHRYTFLNEFRADKENFYGSQCGTHYSALNEPHYQFPGGSYGVEQQPEYWLNQFEETAPPTPDFLPLHTQTPLIADGLPDAADLTGTDDLVGMGLYDAPSPLPASTSFLSGPWDIPIRPALGKGLKLEETFQPPATDEEEDEVASGDDGDGPEEEEEEEEEPRADGAELPYLGLEDKRLDGQQYLPGHSNFAPNYLNQEDAWWSTNATTNQGWV